MRDPQWDRERPVNTAWLNGSVSKSACVCKVRPVTMRDAAVGAVITGEQITRQTLAFTASSLADLLNDTHVKSCVQFDRAYAD